MEKEFGVKIKMMPKVINMKESIWMIKSMDKASLPGLLDKGTWVNMKKMKDMEKERWSLLMALNMSEVGHTECRMDKER